MIRRIPEPATRLSGLRAGEIDIAQVFGDFLEQAQKAGLRIHESSNAAQYWVILTGQTTPDREDYCPPCPWVGDPKDAKSLENARKVRLALNLAVNKKAIYTGLWKGRGGDTPYSLLLLPVPQGLQHRLEGAAARSGAREEAPGRGRPGRRLRGARESLRAAGGAGRAGRDGGGGARLGEARDQGQARAGSHLELRPEGPAAQDQQDLLRVRLAAVRRAGRRVGARRCTPRARSICCSTAPTTRRSTPPCGSSTPSGARS